MNPKTRGVSAALTLVLAAATISPQRLVSSNDSDVKVIALVERDQGRAEIAPDGWPDVSVSGLRNVEAQDLETLGALHAISRNRLRFETREIYDLLEWQINRRLDDMRVRLYLTPFWHDRRLLPAGGVLAALDSLWSLPKPATRGDYEQRIRKFETLPEYVQQVVALVNEAKEERMLPARQVAWRAITSVGRMGSDPKKSVLNQFQQTHDIRNLFVMDGSGFCSPGCQNLPSPSCRSRYVLAIT